MRLWLATAFAVVSVITAGVVYAFGDRPRAVLAAIGLGVLVGFLIAAAIAKRVERLANAAKEMAAAPSTLRWRPAASTRSASSRGRWSRCGPR